MGIDPHCVKAFWLTYGHDILPRKDMFRFLFFMEHTTPCGGARLLFGAKTCSEDAQSRRNVGTELGGEGTSAMGLNKDATAGYHE